MKDDSQIVQDKPLKTKLVATAQPLLLPRTFPVQGNTMGATLGGRLLKMAEAAMAGQPVSRDPYPKISLNKRDHLEYFKGMHDGGCMYAGDIVAMLIKADKVEITFDRVEDKY